MKNDIGQNALAEETSPYLLQHADNPVAWYPWGDTALEQATRENKPILLSIGYSACHWCHVMAHESFEDPETAAIMNQHFINIKVDREERPDIDSIYQKAQQMLTQRTGGWPLTMFLTPEDHIPFFGGTYFPKEPRFGLPDFKSLLLNISEVYNNKPQDIRKQNAEFITVLQEQQTLDTNKVELDAEPLSRCFAQLLQNFDANYGGFSQAPKFPHPTNIERLFMGLRLDELKDDQQPALEMATFSLQKMAEGGLYDHLAGGFARYSVDEYWQIPHFEKMLYDNGPLLTLYSQAYQLTGHSFFQQIAEETANWAMTYMQANDGGFYSSIDADSEGEEGKYYVWDKLEIQNLLGDELYQIIAHHFGLELNPNFEGRWHLFIHHDLEQLARKFSLDIDNCHEKLQQAKMILLNHRQQRIAPGLDDKILGSWNALMIKGMTVCARTFQQDDFQNSAQSAIRFIANTLWQDKQLFASYRDGKIQHNAYLDDYAFLLDALLESLQTQWNSLHLQFAIELANTMIDQFYDQENGGFYFTSHDHEALIDREKLFMDNATPSGSGVACIGLQRLAYLTGNMQYQDVVTNTLKAAWSSINHYPAAHNSLLHALQEYLYPPQSLILRGTEQDLQDWSLQLRTLALPVNTQIYCIPDHCEDLPKTLTEKRSTNTTTAYLCQGHSCLPAFNDISALQKDLKYFAAVR